MSVIDSVDRLAIIAYGHGIDCTPLHIRRLRQLDYRVVPPVQPSGIQLGHRSYSNQVLQLKPSNCYL